MPDHARTYSPEEKANIAAWRYGGTLDWASHILVAIKYPVEENRWFVDAVCGIYQPLKARFNNGAVPITHTALARRAKRFKNKAQASDLSRAAIERDREHARAQRVMVFDIERPKPHEKQGRDKRASTKYTDYLTPAAVWAQAREHEVKREHPNEWKSSKFRDDRRAEIVAEAVKMLPAFEREEDLPASAQRQRCATCEKDRPEGDDGPRYKDECPGHVLSLSEYVEAQQAREAAAWRRIVDKVVEGELTDEEEIDARLAALEVYYARSKQQLETEYESARAALLGARAKRLVTPARFVDPEEVAAEVAAQIGRDADGGDPSDRPSEWLQEGLFPHKKGKAGLTLLVGKAHPPPSPPLSGKNNTYKGGNGGPEVFR